MNPELESIKNRLHIIEEQLFPEKLKESKEKWNKFVGVKDAIKEGQKPESSINEHREADQGRVSTEASSSHCIDKSEKEETWIITTIKKEISFVNMFNVDVKKITIAKSVQIDNLLKRITIIES